MYPFTCLQCSPPRSFTNETEYKQHIRNIHPKTSSSVTTIGEQKIVDPVSARAKKQQFVDFIKLLTEAQRKSKISGDEFRNYRKLWEDFSQNRESLVEHLKLLLKE